MLPVNLTLPSVATHRFGSDVATWSPASLPSLAAWYTAAPAYCYTDGAASFTAASSQYLSGGPNVDPAQDFTIAGWVKCPTGGTLGSSWLGTTGAVFLAQYSLTGSPTLAALEVSVFTGTNASVSTGPVDVTGWLFLVATWVAATKTLEVFVNGSSVGTGTGAGAVPAASPLQLGRHHGGGLANGLMDSFGIWSRVLTGAEVTSLYNAGAGKVYADLTTAEKVLMASFWNLNEASGNRADSHGTNTLTSNNGVTSDAGIASGQCADGDPVSLWTDRSGNARTLSQVVVAARPTLRLVSGRWVVRFDGVDDYFHMTAIGPTAPIGAFVVGMANTASSTFLGKDVSGQNYLLVDAGPVLALAPSMLPVATRATATGAMRLCDGQSDGATIQAFVNAVGGATVANASAFTFDRVGRYNNGGVYWMSGDMAEIVIAAAAVSPANQALTRAYLNAAWGVY